MGVGSRFGGLCVRCRGGRGLCGLTYCPVVVESVVRDLSYRVVGRELYGSSPPSLFIGRYGYPYVYAGPATPPEVGDTTLYDMPELWLNLTLDDILGFRYSLVRGKYLVKIRDVGSRYVVNLQELSLTLRPVDAELVFERIPKPRVYLDEHLPPQGPSAPIKDFRIVSNPVSDRRLEKVYYDTDLRAANAVVELYRDGVPVTAIQRLLSSGGLGVKALRKLVPTRWSITAVDSLISKHLISKVKELPLINSYMLYVRRYMRNLFVGILAPNPWSFEWMEAWFPGSTWNRFGVSVEVEGDYEGFGGRSKYPEIGGCYYAARLAAAEALINMGRQATVILWREIYEGFNLPIGVWFVRENLRAMFREEPKVFSSVGDLINYLNKVGVTRVDVGTWLRRSYIMRKILLQERIDKYFK